MPDSVSATSSASSVNFYDMEKSAKLAQISASLRTPGAEMDQSDFLKVLVAQMSHQDPLSPSSDLDSIGQMASFSSLQELRNMQTDIQTLQANNFLGRTVIVENEKGEEILGTVEAVQMEAGKPQVVVGNKTYDLNQVRTITQPFVAA